MTKRVRLITCQFLFTFMELDIYKHLTILGIKSRNEIAKEKFSYKSLLIV